MNKRTTPSAAVTECPECGVEYPEGEPLLCDCWMGTKEQADYLASKAPLDECWSDDENE